ncbi:hypothetical protein [Kribbella sp. NPDC051718]|uniref:hypothetical protein n=1 Tax=Kribbella sp. NPDC051718 TaxID=3155168 RepID=UPI0034421731
MTLLDRIDQLRTAAVAADNEYQLNVRTGDLRELHARLETTATGLPRLVTAICELRAGGVTLRDGAGLEATSATDAAADLHRTLEALRFDSPLDNAKTQLRVVESFVKRLRETVEDAWAAELERDTALVNDELVEALHRGGADVEDLRQALENATSALLILNSRPLPQAGDMAKLTASFATRRACEERIRDLVPPAVAKLILRARSEHGLPLNLVTPEVLTELDRLGIRERFRVTLR